MSDHAREKGRQGFASMDKAQQREIASKGGIAAHQKGTAHVWTSATAAAAGKKVGRRARRGWRQAAR